MLGRPLIEKLTAAGVVAVVTVKEPDAGVHVAQALLAGGISAIELTFRTSAAAETIERIRSEVPEILVGAGTLLNAGDVDLAVRAGAAFGVAPGCNPRTIQAARDRGLPFAPGVMTPTDIELALGAHCNVMKFFPAQSAGGLEHLRAMAAPFVRYDVRFIPLGGIDDESMAEYLRCPQVICVGGSSFASAEQIQRKDWAGITARARVATTRLAACRRAPLPSA
jgi:2-dehydro-3-deoxyphosphogluconate aldolase / (4S)-4-hydroxy-2-oxoglutarate aldolase